MTLRLTPAISQTVPHLARSKVSALKGIWLANVKSLHCRDEYLNIQAIYPNVVWGYCVYEGIEGSERCQSAAGGLRSTVRSGQRDQYLPS